MSTDLAITGYVVATAPRSTDAEPAIWDLRADYAPDHRPDARTLAQYRQALPSQRVRVFTDEEWDALPYGQQSRDWVQVDGRAVLREKGRIR